MRRSSLGLKAAASARRSRCVSRRRRQNSSCSPVPSRSQKHSSVARVQPSAGAICRIWSKRRSIRPRSTAAPASRRRRYATCAGLISTAVTSSPRAARSKDVHPAEAMLKIRPPGSNASSSTALSSYICPNSSSGPAARRSIRPPCQGVSGAGILLRGEPCEREESSVLREHRLRGRDLMSAERQSAGIHPCDECGADGGRNPRPPAACDPDGECGLDHTDCEEDGLRSVAAKPGHGRDDVDLLRAASQELAPSPVVEPHSGDGRRGEPASELPLHYFRSSRRLSAKASISSSSPATSASSSSAFSRLSSPQSSRSMLPASRFENHAEPKRSRKWLRSCACSAHERR